MPSSQAIEEFAVIARGFCAWCESASLGQQPERQVVAWLGKLYSAALSLPDVGPENDESLADLTGQESLQAFANLRPFLGWYYRELFDPDYSLDDEPVMGDIGDDLIDIYTDIKRGLLSFERSDRERALWHWSFLHRVHWGRHAVGAMFALHCLSISKSKAQSAV